MPFKAFKTRKESLQSTTNKNVDFIVRVEVHTATPKTSTLPETRARTQQRLRLTQINIISVEFWMER